MKISGVVKKHLGRGKRLGFPTANIDAPEDVGEGIYVGYTVIATPTQGRGKQSQWDRHGLRPRDDEGEKKLPSLVFVGAAETFGETERRAEVYILDFGENLYGQEIEVELIKKIRDNIRFDSDAELVEQMRKDEQIARGFFST